MKQRKVTCNSPHHDELTHRAEIRPCGTNKMHLRPAVLGHARRTYWTPEAGTSRQQHPRMMNSGTRPIFTIVGATNMRRIVHTIVMSVRTQAQGRLSTAKTQANDVRRTTMNNNNARRTYMANRMHDGQQHTTTPTPTNGTLQRPWVLHVRVSTPAELRQRPTFPV